MRARGFTLGEPTDDVPVGSQVRLASDQFDRILEFQRQVVSVAREFATTLRHHQKRLGDHDLRLRKLTRRVRTAALERSELRDDLGKLESDVAGRAPKDGAIAIEGDVPIAGIYETWSPFSG